MTNYIKYILTFSLVGIALALILLRYWDYVVNPWTRDGQVRAKVVQIASRISAPIVNLPIKDNQFVKKGDLLFELDPRTFKAELDQAQAQLEATSDTVKALEKQVDVSKANVKSELAMIEEAKTSISQLAATIVKNKAELIRQKNLILAKATSQKSVESARADYDVSIQQELSAQAALVQAQASLGESEANLAKAQAQLGAIGEDNAQVKEALAALRTAELNYEFTKVYAPVDGYVTNINIRLGTQSVANQPILALVDSNSYWIDGYFQENYIRDIKKGNKAVITLMTYSDIPLEGIVDSLGWGISQSDGSTGFELLPSISATFEWIRLAQRVPVRIQLKNLPKEIALRVGTTCSVLVMTQGQHRDDISAPILLQ
ncbi:MAG: HlyD family secretion protein [Gammaproteobacteria bacterium]|nr:HlyD family secretion protein [Gammaproteobacteria bacterium]